MTAFTKLGILVTPAAAEACSARVEAWDDPAALAVTAFEHSRSGGWIVEAYFDEGVGMADLAAQIAALGAVAGDPARTTFEAVPEDDWTAKVQRDLAPVRAGRFVIHGSHDRARVRPAAWGIEIDAGEAFGTAHHATTCGCLEAIDRLGRRGHAFTRIADIGCGTGVLAIAAAKTWPRARVTVSDNDPIATRIARRNARIGGVGGRLRTVTAAGLSHPILRRGAPYDLIVANILARPLVALAPAFVAALGRRGTLVLSGLLVTQAREVLGAYRARGLVQVATLARGEWMTLVLARPSCHKRAELGVTALYNRRRSHQAGHRRHADGNAATHSSRAHP